MAKLQWDMDKQGRKKCVVVDVDDTIIDNSPFQTGLFGKDYGYNNTAWKEWCEAANAKALPGVLDFLNHVVKTGGDVFYITNRKSIPSKNMDLTASTMRNLKALGYPHIDKKHMFLRTNTSSKQPRRDPITRMGYRVILLLGDNLADFTEDFDGKTKA